mmetsp:Transcript_18353/g.31378  ORF Transcript_18353/g.31378 Transcript_18353/m.31378 type:complete len:294 (-) Transcript_18353:1454-2335(-)
MPCEFVEVAARVLQSALLGVVGCLLHEELAARGFEGGRPVLLLQHLVYAHHPHAGGVGLSKALEVDVLDANVLSAGAVEARLLSPLDQDLPEPVVKHFVGYGVGEALTQLGSVHPEVAPVLIVVLLDHVGEDAGRDPHEPEELAEVVTRHGAVAPEDDEDVLGVERLGQAVGLLLVAGQHLAHGGDVRVVPGVVVHDDGPVAHARDLVAVVPPAQDLRLLRRVLLQPVVGLSVVVNDDAVAVGVDSARLDDLRVAQGLGRVEDGVEDVVFEDVNDHEDEDEGDLDGDQPPLAL